MRAVVNQILPSSDAYHPANLTAEKSTALERAGAVLSLRYPTAEHREPSIELRDRAAACSTIANERVKRAAVERAEIGHEAR